jgi:tetratricopeptide (TPR) repeat protein
VTSDSDDDVTATSPRRRGFWDKLFGNGEPERIGRYRILSLLGEGGMGRVHLVEDDSLQRRLAVKTLKEDNRRLSDRFKREAIAAAKVNHPNICKVFDVGEDRGRPFLVMELLEGETLARRLKRGPLAVAEALALAREVLSALEAVHEAGIVHRDLKPSNVFLTAHGARLLDFGLARALPSAITRRLESDGEKTASGIILGTPGFMAPEQIHGGAVDARTDLFAVGIILYEALTGRPPFPGETPVQLLAAVLHEEPAPVGSSPRLMALDAPLRRALAKSPEKRFASAREMAEALQRAGEAPTAGRVPSTGEAFVGRQDELAELEERLASAKAGSGSVVFVTGERGVGKSMLVAEFLRRVRSGSAPVSVSVGRCVEPSGPAEVFLPFFDALGSLLLGSGRERTTELLRDWAPTICVQFRAGLLPDPDGSLHRQAVGATKDRLAREAGDFVEAASRDFPVVLYLEDLQWIDAASVDLLHHMACRVARQRTLIIASYRPADMDAGNAPMKRCALDLVARGVGREMTLGAFSPEEVRAYLDARFSPNDFPATFAGTLHARTEGLPLFVRSLVDLLRDRGEIVRDEGVGVLKRPVEELDLEPAKGLLELVRQHIELLPEENREVLQHASVVGREFLSVIVADLLGAEEAEVEERLRGLSQVRRLIQERGEEELPDGTLATRYRFAHGLYESVLYQDLVASRRVQIHRKVAERLRHRWGEEAPRLGAELARHCELGRDFTGAVTFRLHTADNAIKRFAFDEAAEQCEWAWRSIEKVPRNDRPHMLVSLHEKRGTVRHAQARFDEAADDFRAMLNEARSVGSVDAEMAALAGLCDALFFARRVGETAGHARELLDTADRCGDTGAAAEARGRLGQVLVCEGRLAEAIPLLDGVIEIARSDGSAVALQLGLMYRGLVHYWQAEFEAAQVLIEEAARIAADRSGFDYLGARMFVGLSHIKLGRISEGIRVLLDAIALARRNNDRFWLPRLVSYLGTAHREILAPERALEFDTEAHRLIQEAGIPQSREIETLVVLASDAVRLGDLEQASALLAELEEKATDEQWFGWMDELRVSAVSAERWAASGEWEKATAAADRLERIARRLGSRDYRCAAERVRAEIALARGEAVEAAARRLAQAVAEVRRSPAPLETWRAGRVLGRVRSGLGDQAGAAEAFAVAGEAVHTIAAGITDAPMLHEGFLAAEPVREVLDAAPGT